MAGAASSRWEDGSVWGTADVARAVDLDLRLDVPMAAHAQIEPRAATARWSADRMRVEAWTGTQDVFFVRGAPARRLGLREDAVVLRSCRMSGAFGGRTVPNVEREAVRRARAVAPRPVLVQLLPNLLLFRV